MLSDIRYALRTMRRTPGFTAIAIFTLALGIGGNTAIFSVVNSLLLRPLPLRDPARLVLISGGNAKRNLFRTPFSVPAYETLRDRNRSFSGITAYCGDGFTLTGVGDPEHIAASRVAPNFFDVLGTQPMMGRSFLPQEGEPGGKLVAIISSELWHRRFAANPAILGQTITLDQDVYTVIGVMPPDFQFPFPEVDIWTTRVMVYKVFQPAQIRAGAGYLIGIARLKPGVSQTQADSDINAIGLQYRAEHPASPDADPDGRYDLLPLQEALVTSLRPTLLILSGAVALVLLIACANVASLLLARATGRAKEIAVRSALGAGRADLVRQLLAESMLLALAGGVLGVLFAEWAVPWLVKSNGVNLTGSQPVQLDLAVLAFTVGISILTGIAFGLVPAIQVSRPDLNHILRDSGWGTTGGRGRHIARSVLVVGQVSLSLILLIGAALLIDSLQRLQNVNPGFDPQHALVMGVALPPANYPEGPRRSQFFHAVVTRLEAIPGVKSATAALGLPMSVSVAVPILAEGQPALRLGQRPLAQWNAVTPSYFKTMGIPVLLGRDFTWADDERAPKVVIVNEMAARKFWPHQSPLGKHITFTRFQYPAEIVGVTGDVKNRGLDADPIMVLYSPYPQWTWPSMTIAARTEGDPRQFMKSARAAIMDVDKEQAVTGIQTLEDRLMDSLSDRRGIIYLLAGFAGIALLLAVVGIYGVMAHSVAQRTTELGIRQAVGAQRSDILRLIIGQGMRLSLIGIVLGVAAAVALTRLIQKMLFQVSATDPLIFVGISALFLTVALAASLLPAYRATRVDPAETLRG